MSLRLVSGVNVVVRAMVAGVLVVMNRHALMVMPMFVLVAMLMPVGVRVLMGVRHVSVGVFVRMAVGMLVGVQMLMFVVALHCELLSFGFSV
jgi:hypothetical protein